MTFTFVGSRGRENLSSALISTMKCLFLPKEVSFYQIPPFFFLSVNANMVYFSPFTDLKKNIAVECMYNVALVSGIQKSDSVIHIIILFQVLFSYR